MIATVTRTSRALQLRGTCTAANNPQQKALLDLLAHITKHFLGIFLLLIFGRFVRD